MLTRCATSLGLQAGEDVNVAIDRTFSSCYRHCMNLKTYLNSLNRNGKEQFAARLRTSIGFLAQIAYGHRRCSPDLAIAIERDTAGAVTVADLRPEFAESLKAAGYVRVTEHQAA